MPHAGTIALVHSTSRDILWLQPKKGAGRPCRTANSSATVKGTPVPEMERDQVTPPHFRHGIPPLEQAIMTGLNAGASQDSSCLATAGLDDRTAFRFSQAANRAAKSTVTCGMATLVITPPGP